MVIKLVSTILCPRCKTKNSKKAVVCYKCQATLKQHKKPSILSSNPKSKIDLKIILIGITIFVASNVLILSTAPDYAFMISGFATLLYLYFAFKDSTPKDTKQEMRSYGFKVILNYIIIVLLGIVAIYALGFV